MIDNKKILAIIPARSGSKGLPGKNIKPLHGKPLIAWSIEAALKARLIDNVVVSTDSEEIAGIARNYGAEVPFIRPEHLATDKASSLDVVKHCIDYYSENLNLDFDIIVLLEPTSPLREPDDLAAMLRKLSENYSNADAIISLGEVSEHPSIVKVENEQGYIEPFSKEVETTTRRQDNKPVFFPYGVAYMVKTKELLNQKTFYPAKSMPFYIKRYQCYEIDDYYDFLVIEAIMKYEWKL